MNNTMYTLLPKINVTRKNPDGSFMPVDKFANITDLATTKQLLNKPGHTLVEYLTPQTTTKLYFDVERYIGNPDAIVRDQLQKDFYHQVVNHMNTLINHLKPTNRNVTYKMASRHGIDPKKQEYKLSFRTYVIGVSIVYHDIPILLSSTESLQDMVDFWDMSVYKESEQLLCTINGIKGRGDERVLESMEWSKSPDYNIMDYVVQYIDSAWPIIEVVEDVDYSNEVDEDNEVVDEDNVTQLVKCLGPTSASSRSSWCNVAIILKNLGGGSPKYFDAWIAFSKLSPSKYNYDDCKKLWYSLKPPGKRVKVLTEATLHKYAMTDNPAMYEEWKQQGWIMQDEDEEEDEEQSTQLDPLSTQNPVFDELAQKIKEIADLQDVTSFMKTEAGIGFQAKISSGQVIHGFINKDTKLCYLDGIYVGSLCQEFEMNGTIGFLHNDIPPRADTFKCKVMSEIETMIESQNPVSTKVQMFNTDNGAFAKVNVLGKREAHISAKSKMKQLDTMVSNAMSVEMSKTFSPSTNNLFLTLNNNGTIIVNNSTGQRINQFEIVRDGLLNYAMSKRHRKANGIVYEPIKDCPCAYVATYEDYGDYVSYVLGEDPTLRSGPNYVNDLVKYMQCYKHEKCMPEYKPDIMLLSFRNGALELDLNKFTPYAIMQPKDEICKRVARHHIDDDYTGETDTPLLDKIMLAQFDDEIATLLYALIGRLFFPVSMLDGWQVMPYLTGVGGTGKSQIMLVIASLFRPNAIGALASKREEVFGMANIIDKEIIIGSDMPASLSKAIRQEDVQSMTSGEPMEIARKGKIAINKVWTSPIIMCSNHMPDYVNTGNNIGRRMVTFRFNNPIAKKDNDLLKNIRESELPNIVAKGLASYALYRIKVNEAGDFWRAVPPQINEWQKHLSSSTSQLYKFFSMDDAERGFKITKVPGKVTWLSYFKEIFHGIDENRKANVNDAAVFHEFDFKVSSDYQYICRACSQLARSKPIKCCDGYNGVTRLKKIVIFDMEITRYVNDVENGE